MRFRIALFLVIYFVGFLAKGNVHSDTLTSDSVRIDRIIITGNKRTIDQVVLRELMFQDGQFISSNALQDILDISRRNLLNTSLFNFVKIHSLDRGHGHIWIYISLTERWYIWPGPILEIADRNFNSWWRQKDWSRLNYGFILTHTNFRGRREALQVLVRMGTWQHYRLAYSVPYIDRRQRSGLFFSASYLRNREIGYKSRDNRLLWLKDPGNYVRQETLGKIRYQFRQGIFVTHAAELRYASSSVEDTVLVIGPDYFNGNRNSLAMLSLHYIWVNDRRDSRAYPLDGWLVMSELSQSGLGILSGEDFSIFKADLEFRGYLPLGGRWYAGASARGRLVSTSKQPYYLQKSLGYGNDFVRGYEYYVVDGQHFVLSKTQLRYQLVKPREYDFGDGNDRFDRFHFAFYLGAFCDGAYVWDKVYMKENPLSNTFIRGYGLSLDFVTYYDRVMRFELSRNGKGETGFFFHYGIPF
jgi:outer membrane protein assembly factor BamA